MENFKAKYIFPSDYKKNMQILFLNSYQSNNAIICLSFCFLWIGSVLIIINYLGYGLLLIAISLVSFFSTIRNLIKTTNNFIKKHQIPSDSKNEKTIVLSNKIHIEDLSNNEKKEYRYTDIESLIESKDLFIIRLKSSKHIPIYKDNFTIGNPSELKDFLYKKNPFEKYTYAKFMVSNSTIWTFLAVIVSTTALLLFNI